MKSQYSKVSAFKGNNLLLSGLFLLFKNRSPPKGRAMAGLFPAKCVFIQLNPTALRKAKIACNFGLSECNRVK